MPLIFATPPFDNFAQLCYYASQFNIVTLIKSGEGNGPMNPQQPPKRREGAKSVRSCLEDERKALTSQTRSFQIEGAFLI